MLRMLSNVFNGRLKEQRPSLRGGSRKDFIIQLSKVEVTHDSMELTDNRGPDGQ